MFSLECDELPIPYPSVSVFVGPAGAAFRGRVRQGEKARRPHPGRRGFGGDPEDSGLHGLGRNHRRLVNATIQAQVPATW